jgi:2-polyprenyl-3-methyl-5-hydroxy-6-metoxy-1,4-benzoquinol methylase
VRVHADAQETNVPTIREQESFYDDRWRSFTFADGLKLERSAAILKALAETGIPAPRVIELGCGAGWLTAILGLFGPAEGVELSPLAVEEARQRFGHVRFRQVDLGRWDAPRERFDVVVSHEVIEHLEDQQRHLRTAHDLLVDGGYLILTTPNARTLHATSRARLALNAWQPIERWLSSAELRRMLARQGFELRSLTTLTLGTADSGIDRIVNSVKLNRLIAALGLSGAYDRARRRLGFGLHFVAVARKRAAVRR